MSLVPERERRGAALQRAYSKDVPLDELARRFAIPRHQVIDELRAMGFAVDETYTSRAKAKKEYRRGYRRR